MSQHSFFVGDRKDGMGLWEIIVGWDDPLKTFFAQVWDVTGNTGDEKDERLRGVEDTCELWAGTEESEIETVEILASIVQLYGEIPDDVLSMLRDDKAGLTPL